MLCVQEFFTAVGEQGQEKVCEYFHKSPAGAAAAAAGTGQNGGGERTIFPELA
jgi:hypothetical protein